MLATTFAETAGVDGYQKWGLVLTSSARVLYKTDQTVVGVRYTELVTFNRVESFDSEAQLLARKAVISSLFCKTAKTRLGISLERTAL